MKKFFISHIKNCDTLGNRISLKIQGADTIKSSSGGIITILLWLTSFAVSIFNFSEFMSMDNPRVTEGTQVRNASDIVSISKYFLNFSIGISEYKETIRLIPLSIVDKSVISYKGISNPYFQVFYQQIGEVIDCNNIDFIAEVRSQYSYFNYSNCVGQKFYNDTIKLEGSFQLRYELLHKFSTDLCVVVDKENCRNLQSYQSLNNTYSLSFLYNQIATDMRLKIGYYSNLSVMTHIIDLSKDYIIEMMYTRHIMYTDPNFLFNLFKSEPTEFFTVKIGLTEIVRSERNSNLLTINTHFSVDQTEILHNRSYLKLDEMLANIFSIYAVLLYFAQILYNSFHYNYLEYKIIKNIYRIVPQDFDTYTSSERNKIIKTALIPIRPLHQNSVINNNFVNTNLAINNNPIYDFNKFQMQLRNRNQHFFYMRHLYLYDYLPCCFNKKSNNRISQYFKLKKLLNHELDIILLIKNMIKIDQMLKIILSDTQQHCFKLLNKRVVDSKIKTKKLLQQFNLTKDNTEDFMTIFDSYNTITTSLNVWDKNILSMIKF